MKDILEPDEFYNQMAPYYDGHIEQTRFTHLSPDQERSFLESVLGDKGKWLDFGCGTGRTMELLARGKRKIIGIDASGKMVELAARKGLHVVQGSVFELPFSDGSFDAAYSIHMGFGFCRTAWEMERLAKEAARILRCPGTVILDTPHALMKGAEYVTRWRAGEREIVTVGYGKTREQVANALVAAGFGSLRFYGWYNRDAELTSGARRIIAFAAKL